MPPVATWVGLHWLLAASDGLAPWGVLAAAAVITLMITAILARELIRRVAPVSAPHTCSITLHRRAQRVSVVPQRDPDARGRRRPRAPSLRRRVRVAGATPVLGSAYQTA